MKKKNSDVKKRLELQLENKKMKHQLENRMVLIQSYKNKEKASDRKLRIYEGAAKELSQMLDAIIARVLLSVGMDEIWLDRIDVEETLKEYRVTTSDTNVGKYVIKVEKREAKPDGDNK